MGYLTRMGRDKTRLNADKSSCNKRLVKTGLFSCLLEAKLGKAVICCNRGLTKALAGFFRSSVVANYDKDSTFLNKSISQGSMIMALSLYEIKKILNPKTNATPSDDFRIIDSWAEYEDSESVHDPEKKTLEYLCYELEAMNPDTGEIHHYYKAIRFARVIRLPAGAKQSEAFMDMQQQILTGVYENNINLITVIANMIKPVALGLLYLYGTQGVSDELEDAKSRAHNAYISFSSMMQGTFRVLEMRTINAEETEWLREKLYSMDYLTAIRGIPKANKAGEDAGNKGMGGRNLNPDSEGTLEELISGLVDYEYVLEVISTPVYLDTLRAWQRRSQTEMTEWNSHLQGQSSLSFNLSIPMMYMANASNAQGWSKAHTDSSNVSYSNGQNFSYTQGQSIGESLSHTFGRSVGASTSQTFGQTVGHTVGENMSVSQSNTHGLNFGQSAGINAGMSLGNSAGTSQGGSYNLNQGHNTGTSHNVGSNQNVGISQNQSVSVNNSWTSGQTATQGLSQTVSRNGSRSEGWSHNDGWSIGNSHSSNTSGTLGHSENRSFNLGGGAFGASTGVAFGDAENDSLSRGFGSSHSNSHNQSWGRSGGYSEGWGASATSSSSLSRSISQSESLGYTNSVGTTQSFGTNESYGTTEGQSLSEGWGVNQSLNNSQNISQNAGQNASMSASESASQTLGQSYGQSVSDSYSQSNSLSYGRNYSESNSVSNGQNWSQSQSTSNGQSYTTSNGQSVGESMGNTGTATLGTSASMGLGPSIGYNKSHQWLDQGVKDLLELLDYQNERIKKALRGEGAFYTYVYIACESLDALSAAQAIAKSTWQNEFAMVNPLQVIELSEIEQHHLLYHMMAFSSDITKEDVYGVEEYKFATVLLPEEYVAYTHLPRISEGGVFSTVNDIPKFSVPSMMKGEIYMGTILSAERYSMKNGYKTPYAYRIKEEELMHGYFTGTSRSGKTVAAMRFIAELSRVRRKSTGKRLRIVAMDPKQDWRTLARYVEPERFNFHSLGNKYFRPIKLNPFKIPYGVDPQIWIDNVIDIYCRAYGLLERGKQMMGETIYALYEEQGVFKVLDEQPDNWKEEVQRLSGNVTFENVYKKMESIKVQLEDPNNKRGRAGNDTRDAYARLLDRLQAFARPYSIEHQLFGTNEGIGIDELIGKDDVTILESKGLEKTFKNFIFGVITSGFYRFALAHEGGFLADDQYETVLVIEEANEVLTGNDAAGTGGGQQFGMSGQSEFEEILDQSAGYGLFIIAITQQIAQMPPSIIANAGLKFIGRLGGGNQNDVSVAIRSIAREERYEDRDLVKWFPRCPTGWFVIQSARSFDFKEMEPVLVGISRLNISPPSNLEIDEILGTKQAKEFLKKSSA